MALIVVLLILDVSVVFGPMDLMLQVFLACGIKGFHKEHRTGLLYSQMFPGLRSIELESNYMQQISNNVAHMLRMPHEEFF